MKELSIEEKAKHYDEAIERAKKWYNAPNVDKIPTFGNRVIDEIFPELKESEDKRTRESLLEYLHTLPNHYTHSGVCVLEWIAWLEKQGKPIDKIVKRAMTEKQRVLLTETNGDANIDWDTRSLKDAITLLKHGLNYLQEIEVKKQIMPSSRFGGCSEYISTRFDKEKQGKQGEQKSAWTEEDKNMLKWVIGYLENKMLNAPISEERTACKNAIAWLKDLKDRVQPQLQWKPSDEHMIELRQVISGHSYNIERLRELEEQLKKLREE